MQTIPIEQIIPDPDQPRKEFGEEIMSRIEESIKRLGIRTALHIEKTAEKDKYLLVDGERRYRTAKKLGLKEVPVEILEPMKPLDRLIYRFNVQEVHASWGPMEKAQAIVFLKQEGYSESQISSVIGIPLTTVQNYSLILNISSKNQQRALEKRISIDLLAEIAKIIPYYQKITKLSAIEVEDLLIEKVERRTLKDRTQLRLLVRILKIEGDKKKWIEFLKNKEKSFDDYYRTSTERKSMSIQNISHNASWMKGILKNLIKNKGKAELTELQEKNFRELKELLEQIV